MYKEVAFDPSCMGSMEYYGLVKQHFGYDHGRYISADIKLWTAEAMKHVKAAGLQQVKEKSVKNYLNKLARSKKIAEFLLASDRSEVDRFKWIEWQTEQEKIRPFSFSVSESLDGKGITIDQINSGCEEWNIKRSVSVNKDGIAIIDEVYPLLLLSDDVILIDQHFRLTNNLTFKNLIRKLSNCSTSKLTIVTAMNSVDALSIFTREYGQLKKDNLEIVWLKAPDKFFHDRYLISNVGAIRSGHGFMADVEKGTHADKANLNIISEEESERTLDDLSILLEKGEIEKLFKV